MDHVYAVIEDQDAFDRALDDPLPVFMVFVSPGCGSCERALPLFVSLVEPYRTLIKVLILNSSKTPPHPAVISVPALLVFRDKVLQEMLPGLSEASILKALDTYT